MKKEDAIKVLTDYYRKGEMLGYSNSELSRIKSCINKVESIADEPQAKELSDEEIKGGMYNSLKRRRPKLYEDEFYYYKEAWNKCAKWYRDKLNK